MKKALSVVAVAAAATISSSMIAPAATAAPVPFTVKLKPSGDTNGSGTAKITLDKATGKVCATVTWKGIQTPDAAHIHLKSTGSVVVDLTGSVTGGKKCTTASKQVVRKILERPKRYYFNVHNEEFPAGAIQGNLSR